MIHEYVMILQKLHFPLYTLEKTQAGILKYILNIILEKLTFRVRRKPGLLWTEGWTGEKKMA